MAQARIPQREHLSYEACIKRWPRLTILVQDVLCGSPGEAGCVLRDYRDGLSFSCEACSHSGLTPADRVHQAIHIRHSSPYRRMVAR